MARIYDMVQMVGQHMEQAECRPKITWVPLTSWTVCPIRDTTECLDNHEHARQCDHDGKDMVLTMTECAHARVRLHKCADCGFTKQYGGWK